MAQLVRDRLRGSGFGLVAGVAVPSELPRARARADSYGSSTSWGRYVLSRSGDRGCC